jgi:predicted phosphodiesterase
VPAGLTRILSDLHFGDHGSRVHRLAQLRPLLDGVSHLVLNGDTVDSRPGPYPEHTAACRAAALEFFPRAAPRVTYLSGNHDADFSPVHHLDLAAGRIFVTHGDIFFDDIVPWSRDAALIGRKIEDEFRLFPAEHRHVLEHRFAVFRRVAAAIPQRHQSERNRLKYLLHYLADTVWPPLRTLHILRAWRDAPARAAAFVRRHRPGARFILTGHTHRPGIWRSEDGVTVINSGSFCPPLGGTCIDLRPGSLAVRRVERRRGDFRAGTVIAEFPLAGHEYGESS